MRILLGSLFLFIIACSSSNQRQLEFQKIQIGMVKSEVIATAGPPYWSDRKQGQDRWIYYMNPKDREIERVVYFEDGRVVSKGLRKKPLLSAEEMEAIKADPVNPRPHKRKVSDKELKKIIKKELQKSKKTKAPNQFEKI